MITLLIVTAISSLLLLLLKQRGRSSFPDGLFRVFLAYCRSADLSLFFLNKFLIKFLCLSLSLPCHVRKNIFRLSSTSFLTSKIDNPLPVSSAPFEE